MCGNTIHSIMRSPLFLSTAFMMMSFASTQPSDDLRVCSNELRELADYVRFSIDECASQRSLFQVDGKDLHTILEDLSLRLEERIGDCPCVGPCSCERSEPRDSRDSMQG